ncbi:hypothetical protein [Sphingomonas sp.]|uniref:hypothetical protein n=1 Tax=Sphingomonas sp. TaxID=28214 RepID=UPI001B05B471|nr:hypothetical protein [Sphingomonas sp.]MBO9713085.1 hypothetical protein [Sphingomonas sp.]
MPTDVDRALARAQENLERARARTDQGVSKRLRRHREAEIVARLGRIALADIAIVVGAIVVGLMLPAGIGFMGAMAMVGLLVAATLFFAVMPVTAVPRAEALGQVPLKALPASTERWLEAQRPALPAPTRSLLDSIGTRLETLAPQLGLLDEKTPAALEIRKLVGEQLPELVKGYQRVPEPLRGVPRNGVTPDQQLAQGLQVIDEEIAEMTEQLAQGDLDSLATRGRYLQIRYAEEGGPA